MGLLSSVKVTACPKDKVSTSQPVRKLSFRVLTQRASVLHFACPIALHRQLQCPCKVAALHFNLYEKELIQDDDFYKFVKYFKKWEEKPKYFIGKEETTKIGSNKYKCYRIIANKDIPAYSSYNNGYQLIKSGTFGGCIKSESNLSQEGFCWLNDESYILDKARLEGNSYLHQSNLYGHAKIEGNNRITFSNVCQNAIIKGHNDIHMSKINGNVIIQDNVYVHGSNVFDNVEIFGNSWIYFCNLSEDVWIEDCILETNNIKGNIKLKGESL